MNLTIITLNTNLLIKSKYFCFLLPFHTISLQQQNSTIHLISTEILNLIVTVIYE